MIERREFISICRQIGAMMEVGVDFLRITQALRAQTDNPRLLELYDQLDADLKEGDSLSEAMSHAPDVFSPFAVSLVQQGEARGNIEAAWERIADFFRQQAREDLEIGDDSAPLEPAGSVFSHGGVSSPGSAATSVGAGRSAALALASPELFERVQGALGRALLGLALLLACLGAAQGLVELGLVERRWANSLELGVAAVFLGMAGVGLFQRVALSKSEAKCAFCGRSESRALPLVSSPRLAGAAICADCAARIAFDAPLGEAARDEEKQERQRALREVANALPSDEGLERPDLDEDAIVLDDDDPLAPTPR